MSAVSKIAKSFYKNEDGQFAVWTALLVLPMSMGLTVVLDLHGLENRRTELKGALDSAALAAVTDQTLSAGERKQYAKERFWNNIADPAGIELDVLQSDNHKVVLKGTLKKPTIMAGIAGKKTLDITEESESQLTKGATVCMLALDEDSPRSFEVTEGAVLDASTCGIQVNSMHETASVVDQGGKATAKSFCIAGGAQGDHFPYANTQCSLLHNPYENVAIPEPGPCIDQNELNLLISDWRSGRNSVEEHEVLEYQRWADAEAAGQIWYPTFYEKNHLKPGNYCQGLMLEGKEFILDPGVYHITGGSLLFGLGTELIGENVTFVMHGQTDIEIRDGSILNIKAPTSGPMTGLVLAQEMADKPMQSGLYPDVKSTITEGAMLNLLGTVYLPSHKIEFLGGSLSETRAPATSFIANHISIRDGASIGVAVDHVSADITPIVPRSDEGARLVR